MNNDTKQHHQETLPRRKFAKAAVGGAAIFTATQWTKPVVDTLILPAHAQTSGSTIVDLALATPDLSTLVDLLVGADLVETLSGPGPFTVFAPTNAAFENIAAVLPTLSPQDVTDILLHHVVPGVVPASAIPATTNTPPSTVDGPIPASNGVVYVIDQVLIPA